MLRPLWLVCLLLSGGVLSQNSPEGDCPDVYVHQSGGVFSSPEYPGNYSSNALCDYYVSAPEGYHVALAFSTPFEIERDLSCGYDYLSVHDGPSINDTPLGKFCGYEVPAPVFSYGRHLSVRFKSDGGSEYLGFQANIVFKRENCSFEIFENGSSFTSPNYPASYNNIERCEYTVTAPAGHYISLTFHNFSLEDSRNCKSDSLTLYDGDTISHPVLELLCGSLQPQTFFSNENKLLVRMITDLTNMSYGFNASVSFHNDLCNHIITKSGSVITSSNYPANYGNFEKCQYHVHSEEGKAIEVVFMALDIEEDDNCLKDRLTLYNGDADSSVILARLCGSTLPAKVIKTKGENLLIAFTTNHMVTQTGFSARVNFVTAPCNFCSVSDRYHRNCPSNAPPPSFFQQLQLKQLPPAEFLQCRILTGENVTPTYFGEYYWMIADCQENTSETLRSQCTGEDKHGLMNKHIYNPPVYHPMLHVLFKNQFCALCNGHSLDEFSKIITYSTCENCKYTYEFKDGDVLELPSSDCIVHPDSNVLAKCYPFRSDEDIKCPTGKDEKEITTIFSPVSSLLTSSHTCPDEQIVFGEKCVKTSSSCSSAFQDNFLVLNVDKKVYSQCNYLSLRSKLCLFQHFEYFFKEAVLQNRTFNESTEISQSLRSFFLPWINTDPLEWLENSNENNVVLEIPTDFTSKLSWKKRLLAALQYTLKVGGPEWKLTKSCFLKSVDVIEICKASLEQDATKCNGVLEEVKYDENEELAIYPNPKKKIQTTLWYGVKTTLQVSDKPVIGRQLVFCNYVDENHENRPSANLLNDFSCGIAVICLLVTFFIYAAFPVLRNTFGIVVMIFVISLALGIILLQFVNPYIIRIPWLCSLMGIFAHWLWISIFCWMTVLAFDLRKTFGATNMRVFSTIQRKLLIGYFGVGWGLPLMLVSICVILWAFTDVAISYGSDSGGECWINDNAAALAAVSGPLLLCVLTNLILFILIIKGLLEHRSTIRKANSSTKAARENASHARGPIPELIVSIKISVLMGFTWLSGYIVPLTKIDLFNYIFYLLILLQAILIFLFFGANIRVRKLCMGKLGITRLETYASERMTSSRTQSTHGDI